MALIRPRNPYAFPGGSPGVNIAHPAAQGLRLSVVSSSIGGIPLILSGLGVTSAFTINGAISSSMTHGGPATTPTTTTSNFLTISARNEAPTAVTYGMIVGRPDSGGTGAVGVVFNNNGTANVNASTMFQIRASVPGIAVAGALVNSSITLNAATDFFFIAASYNGTTANFVMVNLHTGWYRTAVVSSSHALGTPTQSQYAMLAINAANTDLNARLATFSYSINTFLSLPQLEAWAQDPWGFWYPPTLASTIFAAGARAAITSNQAVSASTSSALTDIKQAGKIASWATASALSQTKQAGKIASWTTASALSQTKQAGKIASWTTASALSLTALKTRLAAIAATTSSALSVTKQVGKIASWVTSSALSLKKQIGKVAPWVTASTVAGTNQTSKITAITSSTVLPIIKAVSKGLTWTTAGAVSLTRIIFLLHNFVTISILAGGTPRVTEGNGWTDDNSVTDWIDDNGGVDWVDDLRVESGFLRATEDGQQRMIEGGTGGGSIVRVTAQVTRLVRVVASTISALSLRKAVGKIAAIPTLSVIVLLETLITNVNNTTYNVLVTVPTTTALSMIKQVGKIVGAAFRVTEASIQRVTEAGVVRVPENGSALVTTSAVGVTRAMRRALSWATSSTLSMTKQVGKTLAWATASAVIVTKHASRTFQTILILTSSAVTLLETKINGAVTTYNLAVGITTATALSMTKQVGKTLAWVTSSTLSMVKPIAKALSWVTSSTLSMVKQVGKTLAWVTSSAVTVTKHASNNLVTILISTKSVVVLIETVVSAKHHRVFNLTVSILNSRRVTNATRSTLTFIKRVGKQAAIATSSAVTFRRAVRKIVAIATTGILSLPRSFARTVRIGTTGSVTVGRAVSKIVAILTSSIMQLETAAKVLGTVFNVLVDITTASAVSIIRDASKVLQTINILTSSTIVLLGATKVGAAAVFNVLVDITTASAVSIIRDASKTLQTINILTSSLVTLIETKINRTTVVFNTVVIVASTSSVTMTRAVTHGFLIITTSALTLIKSALTTITITTTSLVSWLTNFVMGVPSGPLGTMSVQWVPATTVEAVWVPATVIETSIIPATAVSVSWTQ